jgi:bifunctional ADP-heptose synthase (sugar kinase/adenylyltransferase)
LIGQTEWQNLLRQAKAQCDFLIAGVVADEVPIAQKGVTPVVPLAEPVVLKGAGVEVDYTIGAGPAVRRAS